MAKEMTTMLLVGGVAVAGWYAYTHGLLSSFMPAPAPPVPVNPYPGPPVNPLPTKPAVPALGTTIVSMPQALAQMGAKDAYILPNGDLYVLMQTQIPVGSGYNFYVDSKGVPLLLRDDVLAAVNADPRGAAGTVSLEQIKGMMTTAGLTGLGDFRRHMMTRTGRYA